MGDILLTRMELAVHVQHLSRTYNLIATDTFSCWKNASMGSLFSTDRVKSEKTETDMGHTFLWSVCV